jgi:hypothetical protein
MKTAYPLYWEPGRTVGEPWCSFALLGVVGTQSSGKDAVECPAGQNVKQMSSAALRPMVKRAFSPSSDEACPTDLLVGAR